MCFESASDKCQISILNEILEGEKSVEQHEGFFIYVKEYTVYRLHKALYGLKHSPRAWYSLIDDFFSLDFDKVFRIHIVCLT